MMLQVRTNDLKKKKIHLQTWGPYVESESDVLHCLLASSLPDKNNGTKIKQNNSYG